MSQIPSSARYNRTMPSSSRPGTPSCSPPTRTPSGPKSTSTRSSDTDSSNHQRSANIGVATRLDSLSTLSWEEDMASTASTNTDEESMAHFSGRWDENAKREITSAIQATERLIAHHAEFPVPSYGSRWVCVADTVVGQTYFLAHRVGATSVLRGTSVDELKEAICAFALEH